MILGLTVTLIVVHPKALNDPIIHHVPTAIMNMRIKEELERKHGIRK